jgi:hypothetical protein
MPIIIDESNLKNGLLGLVVALVEVITDTLKLEACRRVEGGHLTDAEIDRLGMALMQVDEAVAGIKDQMGIRETVQQVRDSLDRLVVDMLRTSPAPDSAVSPLPPVPLVSHTIARDTGP